MEIERSLIWSASNLRERSSRHRILLILIDQWMLPKDNTEALCARFVFHSFLLFLSIGRLAVGGISRTQMLRKLMGSLLSPCAWSLMAAPSNAL